MTLGGLKGQGAISRWVSRGIELFRREVTGMLPRVAAVGMERHMPRLGKKTSVRIQ